MIKANLIGDNIVKAIDRWQNENSVTRSRKTLFCRNLQGVSTLFTTIVNPKKPHFRIQTP